MGRGKLAAGAVSVIVLWWAISLIAGARIVPSPAAVIPRFLALLPTVLWRHALASLLRVVAALTASFMVALPLGVLMGRVGVVDSLLAPVSYLLFPVPKIALLPVVLLLFGVGDGAKVILVALVLFFQMLLAVRDGVRDIDPRYLLSLSSLGARRRDEFRYVVWPAVLPRLLTSLRIGSGTALAVLFFAETFFTRWGLGLFITDSWMKVSYTDMFAGILAIALLGLGIFAAIDFAERRLCAWQRHSAGGV